MMDVLNATQMRYTTKAYDASKNSRPPISTLTRNSSFNTVIGQYSALAFLIADNIEAKTRIAKGLTGRYAYNAPKVLDASHSIIFVRVPISHRNI